EMIQNLSTILGENWRNKLYLISFEGNVNPETIVPAVIKYYTPLGFRGFILIAILAASMSTFNTTINSSAALFTRDIYQRFLRPGSGNKELIYVTYLFIIMMVSIAFISAFSIASVNEIWGWLMMGLSAGLIIPAFLKFYWWRFNGAGFSIGTIVGILSAFVFRYLYPEMVEWLEFSIITSIALLASIIATYATRKTDDKVLSNFYLTTRPFGFWKPLKANLDHQTKIEMEREHKNDLSAVPFNLVGQVLLFLMPMQLIIGTYQNFALSFIIFIICIIGMYYFWYSNLPPKDKKS
ncbi:MAG: hypothetical protein R3250_09070, partial [Melioribacteraceae bacterium]|nr:hypothetical protein [Melioribacteraceae bacterium]